MIKHLRSRAGTTEKTLATAALLAVLMGSAANAEDGVNLGVLQRPHEALSPRELLGHGVVLLFRSIVCR